MTDGPAAPPTRPDASDSAPSSSPLVQVDPDIVYFRSRLNLLTEQQMGWLQDLATICGFKAVSDPVSWLSAEELDRLKAYLAQRPVVERLGRYLYAVDGRPARVGTAEALEDLQRRGLAGPVGAEEPEELPRLHGEADPVHGPHIAVGHHEVVRLDLHAHRLLPLR